MRKHRVLITGATGMVGGAALRLCLDHPKLQDVHLDDFTQPQYVTDQLEGQDVALYCLGAYTGAASPEELRRITVDCTVAFATTLHERSPSAAFCFLSGQGADPSEQSRIAFARDKGAAENAILARVMVELGLRGETEPERVVLENRDIRARAAAYASPAR